MENVLSIRGLRVDFPTRRGVLAALRDVSFDLRAGEILGMVGESGAGKSLTGAAILGLLPEPGRITGGEIRLLGRRIDGLSEVEMRRVRGKQIGAVFQDPLTALDPLMTVGSQLIETIIAHRPMLRTAARQQAINLLADTGIPSPADRIDAFPHQFSGGMRQRVVIALALAGDPQVVIADEPTTALDVSVQAQIIELLRRLCRERGLAVLLVTHDMGVIAETTDRVAVMYSGRIVEIGETGDIIANPFHPYTQGLMAAIPRIDEDVERLPQIPGGMPRLGAERMECPFRPRCGASMDICENAMPISTTYKGRVVACHGVPERV